jgi:hypothetical protein
MKPDYLHEYRKLRDEFRQAQTGGCANVDRSLNMASYNASWQTLSIDEELSSIESNPMNKSSDDSFSPPEDISTSVGTDTDVVREPRTRASRESVRTDRAPSHLADVPPSEVYPEHRPRKGHKKSRGGCFNCKKRKIKVRPKFHVTHSRTDENQCQENQPACNNCTRKKLKCEYPAPKTLSALRSSFLYSPSPVTLVNLQSTPTVFTLTDMRLFHHYLLDAYPHLPVGNESAWLSQIPLIAHHVGLFSCLYQFS